MTSSRTTRSGLAPDPLDAAIAGFVSQPVERTWSRRDAMLYSLGVGAGATDPFGFELEFTTDSCEGVEQKMLPTFGVIPGTGRPAVEGFRGVDLARITHMTHVLTCHRPLGVEGRLLARSVIDAVYDAGDDAVIGVTTTGVDEEGVPVCTNAQLLHARGAGGFGGTAPPERRTVARDRPADAVVVYETRPDQALLYRLSGDLNRLHSDPVFARRAGFDRPILHGLCTFGFAGRALLHSLCGSSPERFVSIGARFARPVFPGETLTVSIWQSTATTAQFVVTDSAGRTVLDDGSFVHR